ncbi:MAG: hypothetical protein WA705_04525 [Candidatus Ozemobacteraceae bacterium]
MRSGSQRITLLTGCQNWSAAPIRLPLNSGTECFDRPRRAGIQEPFVEAMDRGPDLYHAIFTWALSCSFIGGWLVWRCDP